MSALRAAREALTDEVRIFQIAMGVIAIAVADDAFVHPEPGTSAGDHLVGRLVPIAVALAAGLVFRRLRAGMRACVAIGFGALALGAGIADGVRHIVVATRSPATTSQPASRPSPELCLSSAADPVADTPDGTRRASAATPAARSSSFSPQ